MSWWNSLDTFGRQMVIGGVILLPMVLIVVALSVANFRVSKHEETPPAAKPCRHSGYRIQGVLALTGLPGWMCADCGAEVPSPYQDLGEVDVLAIDPEPGRPYTFYSAGEFAPGELKHLDRIYDAGWRAGREVGRGDCPTPGS